jgi:hypothetical protein
MNEHLCPCPPPTGYTPDGYPSPTLVRFWFGRLGVSGCVVLLLPCCCCANMPFCLLALLPALPSCCHLPATLCAIAMGVRWWADPVPHCTPAFCLPLPATTTTCATHLPPPLPFPPATAYLLLLLRLPATHLFPYSTTPAAHTCFLHTAHYTPHLPAFPSACRLAPSFTHRTPCLHGPAHTEALVCWFGCSWTGCCARAHRARTHAHGGRCAQVRPDYGSPLSVNR